MRVKNKLEKLLGRYISKNTIGCIYLKWYRLLKSKRIMQTIGALCDEKNSFCIWGVGIEALRKTTGKGEWEELSEGSDGEKQFVLKNDVVEMTMNTTPDPSFFNILGFTDQEASNWIDNNDDNSTDFKTFAKRVKEKAIEKGFLRKEDF